MAKEVKLGIITIGQSPRVDFTADILDILDEKFVIYEKGALDNFTYDEVLEKFKPDENDSILVSRLRDGRQVKIGESHILSLLQKCIDNLEAEGIDVILLLCTGHFPEFKHNVLLIKPEELLHTCTSKLQRTKKIGVFVPNTDQVKETVARWKRNKVDIVTTVASPYMNLEQIKAASEEFINNKEVGIIFMDCMGYSIEMKEIVRDITNKPVILPRTLIARILNELY
ncbi:AroM family protein [Abyssisolibacter fermentans]|uniref:AroM family protein n=1 Tax=Abyssisolibacter fermentans TaxID=1766203 RepID=UPI00138EF70C|nr:AroM family protein [Abyssisolibacter fermentans]